MSPGGGTSPTLLTGAFLNGSSQVSHHGMDQLAQASMQSPRLATQNSIFNSLNFGHNANNGSFTGNNGTFTGSNGFSSYTNDSVNNVEVRNPDIVQTLHNQNSSSVKKENERKNREPFLNHK